MYEKIANLLDKLTKHSYIFYVIMFVVLVGISANFFNNEILNQYVIHILIVLNLIPLTSFTITKLTGRKNKSNPGLICPACDGMMKTNGDWKCLNCNSVFKYGKTADK